MNTTKSAALYAEALQKMPGGVSSPVRAFKSVGGDPLFITDGRGAYMTDADNNDYIDYVMSWGPLLRGHAHPDVVAALHKAVDRGTSYGAPSPLEIDLANAVIDLMPNIEMIRFVNSGTEATMSVLRLARAFTGRNKIVKFEGNYHGHADMLLVAAGSGVATLGLPNSPGVPPATVADTLTAQFNDLDSVQALFDEVGDEIAAIILEPVSGNMGLIPPQDGFLEGLRQITEQHGALLVFDEVMTGFRVHPGGAQTRYNIKPDLTALGKVIGGGLPVGAYGGRKEIMEMVAPAGPVYQAGTLSGNPLAMTAGIATLAVFKQEGAWEKLEATGEKLITGIAQAAASAGIPIRHNQVGTMFGFFFTDQEVTGWETAKTADTVRFGRFHRAMLESGIYLAPSQFEAGFVSTAHGEKEISQTIEAAEKAFRSL